MSASDPDVVDRVLSSLLEDNESRSKLLTELLNCVEEDNAGVGIAEPTAVAMEPSKRSSRSSNVSGDDGPEDADVIVLSSGDSDSEGDDQLVEDSQSTGLDHDKRRKTKEAASRKLADKLGEAAQSEDDESSEEDTTKPAYGEGDDSDYVITIHDSDSDEDDGKWLKPPTPPTPMICYRCPNNKQFKNRALFRFHIKRHTSGENFSCRTCNRPFVQLNLCAAHEIGVHGTDIPSNCHPKNDLVILAAKKFWEEKETEEKDTRQHPIFGGTDKVEEVNLVEDNADEKTFDPDIEGGRILASTSFLAYRGPPVNHILECYEIQLNHGRPMSHSANGVAGIAIKKQKSNVKKRNDVDRLGRFAKRSKPVAKLPGGLDKGSEIIAKSTDSGPKKNKPARVVRSGSVTSLASTLSVSSAISSSLSTETVFSIPSPVTAAPGSPLPERLEASPITTPSKTSNKKRKREDDDDLYARPVASPTMSELSCENCDHDWMFDEDAGVSVPGKKANQGKPKRKKRGRKPANKMNTKIKLFLKKNLVIPYKPPGPLPDSSCTEKESFLYAAGLLNKLRLDLHLK